MNAADDFMRAFDDAIRAAAAGDVEGLARARAEMEIATDEQSVEAINRDLHCNQLR